MANELIQETQRTPNLRVGFGVQGIGTGNPGYFATSEKNVYTSAGAWNGYVGVGFRSNEDHGHLLGGIKFSPAGTPLTLGVQLDGHFAHPFATLDLGVPTVGVYLIESKSLGLMLSLGF